MLKSLKKLQKKFSKNHLIILTIIVLLIVMLILKLYGYTRENFFLKNSYSQLKQDLNVLKHFNNKKNGYL